MATPTVSTDDIRGQLPTQKGKFYLIPTVLIKFADKDEALELVIYVGIGSQIEIFKTLIVIGGNIAILLPKFYGRVNATGLLDQKSFRERTVNKPEKLFD